MLACTDAVFMYCHTIILSVFERNLMMNTKAKRPPSLDNNVHSIVFSYTVGTFIHCDVPWIQVHVMRGQIVGEQNPVRQLGDVPPVTPTYLTWSGGLSKWRDIWNGPSTSILIPMKQRSDTASESSSRARHRGKRKDTGPPVACSLPLGLSSSPPPLSTCPLSYLSSSLPHSVFPFPPFCSCLTTSGICVLTPN